MSSRIHPRPWSPMTAFRMRLSVILPSVFRNTIFARILVYVVFAVSAPQLFAHDAPLEKPKVPKFTPRKLMEPLPAITEVPVDSASAANEKLGDKDLVLGVAVNGSSRAYPITMLCGPKREIVNDTVGKLPIAATW